MPIENEQVVKNYLNKYLCSTPIYSDLSGGLNVRNNQVEIKTNEFFSGKNIYLNNNMGIVGRYGIRKLIDIPLTNDSQEINGVYFANFIAGGVIIACSGYSVYAWRIGVSTDWELLTGSITRNYPSSNLYTFAFYEDTLIIADGTNYPLKVTYDGTNFSVTEMTLAPKANYVYVWYSYVFFAGDGTNKIYFSAAGNINDYPLENYIAIGGGVDRTPITALCSLFGYLIIFKETATYALSGATSDTFTVSQINNNVGCIVPNCATLAKNEIYFFGQNGVWKIDSSLSFKYISMNILPRFQYLPKQFTTSNRPIIIYNPYKEQVWLSVDYNNDGFHDMVFVFDTIVNDAITEYYFYTSNDGSINFNPKVFAKYLYNGNYRIIAFNGKDRYLRIYDSHWTEGVVGDDGYIVDAEYESKLFNLGDPQKFKSLRYYTVYGQIGYGMKAIIAFKFTNDMTNTISVTTPLVDPDLSINNLNKRIAVPGNLAMPYKFVSVIIKTPVNFGDVIINGFSLDYIFWQRRN